MEKLGWMGKGLDGVWGVGTRTPTVPDRKNVFPLRTLIRSIEVLARKHRIAVANSLHFDIDLVLT
jgi:hypothetical protein